jgi:hypothetical protein
VSAHEGVHRTLDLGQIQRLGAATPACQGDAKRQKEQHKVMNHHLI